MIQRNINNFNFSMLKTYAQNLGDQWIDTHNVIISGCFGNILSTSNFKSRYFIPVLKELGLEHITFHDLRHKPLQPLEVFQSWSQAEAFDFAG